jgi:hypothetical protein
MAKAKYLINWLVRYFVLNSPVSDLITKVTAKKWQRADYWDTELCHTAP